MCTIFPMEGMFMSWVNSLLSIIEIFLIVALAITGVAVILVVGLYHELEPISYIIGAVIGIIMWKRMEKLLSE